MIEVDETWKAWHFRGVREGDTPSSTTSSSFSCMTQFPAQASHTAQCPSVFQGAHSLLQPRVRVKGRAEGRERWARWTTTKGAPHPFVYILCTFGSGRRGPPHFPFQPFNKAHFTSQTIPLGPFLPPAPSRFKKGQYRSALTINICAAFSNCSMSDGAGRRDCHLPSVAKHHRHARTNARSPTHVDVTFYKFGFRVLRED